MIRSMTGFGDASATAGGVHYFVEVRSLNSKYFKAVIRLPEDLQPMEAEIEQRLRHRLRRGSVFMSAKLTDESASAAYEINEAAIARYLDQLSAIPALAERGVRIDLAALLSLPGVLQPPGNEEERLDRARDTMLGLVDKACEHLESMRKREGQLLYEDLMTHRAIIVDKLALIAEHAPRVVEAFEERLRSRISSMLTEAGIVVQAVDLIREVGIAAERADISEEISRLSGHADQFADLVGGASRSGDSVGRTLDFLAQEMLREANTIASKSADSEIARAIVEVKGAIDRIKEQVQNVE